MIKSVRRWAVVMALVGITAGVVQAQDIRNGRIPAALHHIATVSNNQNGAPNFGVHSGDSRFLYIGQQDGRVRILDFNQPNPLLANDFLNIDVALGAGVLIDDTNRGERGLLGAAFHPDFNESSKPNGYRKFYTFTSESANSGTPHFFHQSETFAPNHQSVIREWTANAPNPAGVLAIDTSTPSRVLMRIAKPGQFHNGGALAFGPDKYLYISTGDGGVAHDGGNSNGSQIGNNTNGHTGANDPDTPGGYTGHGNAQDRRNVYGKILRIKPTTEADPDTNPSTMPGTDYRVPKSNPFTSDTNAQTPVPGWQNSWVDELYASGFRNPFRLSFDADNGNLYAADVGQDRNTSSREEVSRIVNGGNYGWIIRSGDQTTQFNYSAPPGVNLINPIAQYPTTQLGQGGLAAIGGFVYRGSLLPKFEGKYIFADLDAGTGTGGRILHTDIIEPGLNQVFDMRILGAVQKPNGAFIHGVAQDAKNELYFLFSNGQILKLVPEPSCWLLAAIAAIALGQSRRRRSLPFRAA